MKTIPTRSLKPSLKEPHLLERFNIRDLQAFLGEKDMVQELHRHAFFFILVLEKGEGTHEIDFTPYAVGDYTVFFMRPGQVHHQVLKAGSTGYIMGFSTDFYEPNDRCANQLLRRIGTMNHCVLDSASFRKIMPPLASAYTEYQEKQEGYEDVIKANLCIFFMELVRKRLGPLAAASPGQSYAQEQLDAFFALLDKHVAEHKQVTEYAGMLNLSPYQLNAITKTQLGKTSSELINDQVILEAKRNLLATTVQVKEIAYQLGYEDVSYFSRFFKKQTGHTPEAFRQLFR